MKTETLHACLVGVIAVICLVAACAKEPISTNQTDNEKFEVDKLFTQDGCPVYRFMDNGYYHYFVTCPGSTSETYKSGKSTKHEEISTGVPE